MICSHAIGKARSAMNALTAMAIIQGVASRMPDDAGDDQKAPAPS